MLKAQQMMEESQFDPEEGSSSYKSQKQTVKAIMPLNHDEPSTSKKSPTKIEETQSSAEDIR